MRYLFFSFSLLILMACASQPKNNSGSFKDLFNGIDLNNWIGNKSAYQVKNGAIIIEPEAGGSGGNLYTKEVYANFILQFEFLLTPGANNGLGIHTPLEGDPAYAGKEIQILDNTAEKYANLKAYQYHGSVYGIAPAKRGHLAPVGQWNKEEVFVKDNLIRVTLNETVIVETDLNIAIENGTMDNRDHPGLFKKEGHIAFCGHGDVVHFRNIRIKEL